MHFSSKWRKLAADTAALTASSVVMRCIAMFFQSWLVGKIGSAGIGLYQLTASVNMLCAAFAVSGIRFTSTRLISEGLGSGTFCTRGAVLRCFSYALLFGFSAFAILFTHARPIGFLWIGDARTVQSLRIIAFRMPFIAASSVLNGCFIAEGKARTTALIQLAEQLSDIFLVVLFLSKAPVGDLSGACAAVSLGNVSADIFSFFISAAVYLADRKNFGVSASPGLTKRMLTIALPLALSAYARTALTTLENLLVPRKLKASGLSADSALSGYGAITGMVFPIIGFPTCLLSALAELIIPDLTQSQSRGDFPYIRKTVYTLGRITLAFSVTAAALIFAFSDTLARLIYHDASIGRYIRALSFLIPVMYSDIVTDGCLKGLGQMMNSMFYNIAEALIGVLLVITLLPRFALRGYIAVLYVCEIFNFSMSINRLRKIINKH